MGDKYYIFKPESGRVDYTVRAREIPATQHEIISLSRSCGQYIMTCDDMQSVDNFMRAKLGEDFILNRVI